MKRPIEQWAGQRNTLPSLLALVCEKKGWKPGQEVSEREFDTAVIDIGMAHHRRMRESHKKRMEQRAAANLLVHQEAMKLLHGGKHGGGKP